MQVLISVQEAQVQVLFLLITGDFFGSLLLELLNLYKKWSIHQIRAPASIIWLLGWQLWDGNAPAVLQTRLISGKCHGSECSSAMSPPAVHCLSEPKICPQEFLPVPALWNSAHSCRSALSNEELRFLTNSRLNQHKRDGNFITFYVQAQRHLRLGVPAKSSPVFISS